MKGLTRSLFVFLLIAASPAVAQVVNQSGSFTLTNGQVINYTGYQVNSNGTITYFLVGGGQYTHVGALQPPRPPIER